MKKCSHIFIASNKRRIAPNKYRKLKTTAIKVKCSPAKVGFIRLSSGGNSVFVHRGNEGFMVAYATKGASSKESAYVKPFLDHLNETKSNKLDILMVLSRKAEGLDKAMTVRGKDGTDYPFKQFVKFVEADETGNYCATEDDAKEFGSKLAIALQNTGEYKYPPKFIFSGDLSVGTGAVPWTDLLTMNDVKKLVTELYGDSIENSSFVDDAVTVKSIYGSQWSGKEIKDFYFQ